jgi:anti-sigma factor RsiW
LDAKTTLEIQQHLAACPACAHVFAEAERLEARMMAGLDRGLRTAALWGRIESSVVAVASSAARPRPPARVSQPVGWPAVFGALGTQLRAGWQASRWAWTGLAAVWVVILTLNLVAREPDTQLVAGQKVPSASEMRFALKQKQLLMAELAVTSEPASADKSNATPPRPRSDRRIETLNT